MCLSKGLGAVQQSIDEGVLPYKRLGFIPTAGEPYPNAYFIEESRARLRKLGIELVELDVSNESQEELQQKLDTVDGVYIAGGNTFFLSQQLRRKKLNEYMAHKVKAGLPYFGESAGAVYLSTSIEPAKPFDNPQNAPDLDSYEGLGLIDFFVLPHVDREKYRDVFQKFLAENEKILKIVKIRDDQALLTRDGSNYEILPSSISEIR